MPKPRGASLNAAARSCRGAPSTRSAPAMPRRAPACHDVPTIGSRACSFAVPTKWLRDGPADPGRGPGLSNLTMAEWREASRDVVRTPLGRNRAGVRAGRRTPQSTNPEAVRAALDEGAN